MITYQQVVERDRMPVITKLGVCRSFRAAIIHAINYQANDPATMMAVDVLAESKAHGIEGMLDSLWKYPETLQFDHISSLGIDHSPLKQAAVLTITGRSWADWRKFMEVAK